MTAIKAGKYKATIEGFALRATNKGDPMVSICFAVKDEGASHSIYWNGTFGPNAMDFTLEALLVCGLKGNDLAILAKGPAGGGLDMLKEVQVSVEYQENQRDGKMYPTVKWINEGSGARFNNVLPEAEAVTKMRGLNLSGNVAAMRAQKGYKDQPAQKSQVVDNGPPDMGDIPF